MSDEEKVRRAERAQAILDDPLVIEAFAAIEQEAFEKWRTGAGLIERESAHEVIVSLDRFRARFKEALAGGKVADHRLAEAKRAATPS